MILASGDIWLVGDSTMCFYEPGIKPREGWGMHLGGLCREAVRVHNRAVSGRSTKSYEEQGYWKELMGELRPGSHVVIGMAHNDGAPAETRPQNHTEPDSDFKDNLKRWIAELRAIGAIPFLVTSTVVWGSEGLAANTTPLRQYNQAILSVAEECGVDTVDLNDYAFNELNKMTLAQSCSYYMATSGVSGSETDYCHLQAAGAKLYAEWFVKLCKERNFTISKLFR